MKFLQLWQVCQKKSVTTSQSCNVVTQSACHNLPFICHTPVTLPTGLDQTVPVTTEFEFPHIREVLQRSQIFFFVRPNVKGTTFTRPHHEFETIGNSTNVIALCKFKCYHIVTCFELAYSLMDFRYPPVIYNRFSVFLKFVSAK